MTTRDIPAMYRLQGLEDVLFDSLTRQYRKPTLCGRILRTMFSIDGAVP
jgi:hypothetical protein